MQMWTKDFVIWYLQFFSDSEGSYVNKLSVFMPSVYLPTVRIWTLVIPAEQLENAGILTYVLGPTFPTPETRYIGYKQRTLRTSF
jgi:hypothetical protein